MSFISKIIELSLVAQSISSLRSQVGILLRSAASIFFLFAFTFIFALIAIICLYTEAYLALTEAGLMPMASIGIIFGVTVCILIGFILAINKKCGAVKVATQVMPTSTSVIDVKPTVSRWGFKIIHSFLDGLETGRSERELPR